MYASSVDELAARPIMSELVESKIFKNIIILSRSKGPGSMKSDQVGLNMLWIKIMGSVMLVSALGFWGLAGAHGIGRRSEELKE